MTGSCPHYRLLQYDSDLLGQTVARLDIDDPADADIKGVFTKMRAEGVSLVYLFSSRELGRGAADMIGARLVDRKTTYKALLDGFIQPEPGKVVERYSPEMPLHEMEILSVQSGEYSRFNVDPCFPKHVFEQMYRTWMRKSLSGEMADEVLVIRVDSRVAGMITLAFKSDSAEIGLVAVERGYRGKGFGMAMASAAMAISAERGFRECRVVTQGDNLPACRMYEKCGFAVANTAYCYHVWLTGC